MRDFLRNAFAKTAVDPLDDGELIDPDLADDLREEADEEAVRSLKFMSSGDSWMHHGREVPTQYGTATVVLYEGEYVGLVGSRIHRDIDMTVSFVPGYLESGE